MSQSKRPRTENETPSEKFVREHTSEDRAHYKQEADNALHRVYDIIANAGVSEKDPSEMTIREIQDEIYKLRRALEDAKHTCECTMSERPNCVVM
mmetsp:Transcript_8843/g.27627  ORF Transcript_8843/g.27627 Transcript_8843/m.27627 type:complete len:95 (+) Transcript_8843:58-342(+)